MTAQHHLSTARGLSGRKRLSCGYASSQQAGFALQSKARESKGHSGAENRVAVKKPRLIRRHEWLEPGGREGLASPRLGPGLGGGAHEFAGRVSALHKRDQKTL